jgi:SAM-dependent methyltransferase
VTAFASRTADHVPEGARLLDLGAGEGHYRAFFPGRRYLAVDLAVGDGRWDYGGLDVLADLHRLPFRDGSVDAILTTQTLEHLTDPQIFLDETARVLRPGGTLHLTAPQSFREHQAPHDYFRYTRYGLRLLAERAGYADIEIEDLGGFFCFMGDRFPALHRYLFPKDRALLLRILLIPFWIVSKVLFAWLAPPVCARLDGLDRKRTWVNGYGMRARRPVGDAAVRP